MTRATRLEPHTAHPVPQNYDEAVALVAEVGRIQRDLAVNELSMNESIDHVKQTASQVAAPLREREKAAVEALQKYCEVSRGMLTKDGKVKYHQFATGKVQWRNRPASVRLRGIPQIIETIKRLGANHLLRVKEEVNKDAMLADPELARGISGVSIGSAGEDFVVEPDVEQIAHGQEA